MSYVMSWCSANAIRNPMANLSVVYWQRTQRTGWDEQIIGETSVSDAWIYRSAIDNNS